MTVRSWPCSSLTNLWQSFQPNQTVFISRIPKNIVNEIITTAMLTSQQDEEHHVMGKKLVSTRWFENNNKCVHNAILLSDRWVYNRVLANRGLFIQLGNVTNQSIKVPRANPRSQFTQSFSLQSLKKSGSYYSCMLKQIIWELHAQHHTHVMRYWADRTYFWPYKCSMLSAL